jgi:integrase
MGRNRKRNKHLPPRVYDRRGKLYYVMPGTEEWIPLPDGLKTWAKIVEGADAAETMSALWAQYQVAELHKKAAKTQKNRKQEWSMLEPVFGAMKPADIEPHHAWNYWKKRGEIEQAKKEVRCLSALLTFARQTGVIKHENPCFDLKFPESKARDLYVTDEMFLFVRERAPTMIGYAMDLAYITGMDQGTIRKLERRHLTDEGIEFERGKTGKLQLVEWNDELKLVIEAIKRERPQLRQVLICNARGKAFTANAFQLQWQRLLAKCKTEGFADHFHFHDLRAKRASDADTDQEAADALGHADVRVTRKHYRRLPQRSKALRILDKQRDFGRRQQ